LAAADVATDANAEIKLGDTVKWSPIPLKFYPCELSGAASEALAKACDALAPAAPLSRDAVEGLVARLVNQQYYVYCLSFERAHLHLLYACYACSAHCLYSCWILLFCTNTVFIVNMCVSVNSNVKTSNVAMYIMKA
jgi:hypothetical protein